MWPAEESGFRNKYLLEENGSNMNYGKWFTDSENQLLSVVWITSSDFVLFCFAFISMLLKEI